MLTHQNLISGLCIGNDLNSGCVHRPLPPDVEQYIALSIIPVFHIYGLVYNTFQPLTLGVKMVSLPKFDPALFISTMESQKPTYMNVVPPLVMMLALNPMITKEKHLAKCEVISSGNLKSEGKKRSTFKNWPLIKNPHFFSDFYEIW